MTTLGSLLVQKHIVGVVDIEKALQRQVLMGGDLATNMLELSLVDEEVLAKYTARAFGIPLLDRSLLDEPDEKLVKMIPWETANAHRIVPVRLEGNVMTLATFQPIQEHALEEIGFLLGVEFSPQFVLEFRLAIALHRCYGIEISERFAKLQKMLAPETISNTPPITPKDGDRGLVTGIDPRADEDAEEALREGATTVPAATEYYDNVEAFRPDEQLDEVAFKKETAPLVDTAEETTEPETETGEMESFELDEKETESEPRAKSALFEKDMYSLETAAEQMVAEGADEPPTKVVDPQEVSLELPKEVAASEAMASSSATPAAPVETLSDTPATPLNLEDLGYRLLQVTHRDEVIQTFMESLMGAFEYAMLFVIQGKDAHACIQMSAEDGLEKIDSPVLAVDSGGMLEIAYNTRSFYLGQPGKNDTDRLLLHEMNRRKLRNCAIVPFTLRNRVIMLLYCDCGVKGVKATQMSDLSQVARLASEAFERLLLEKKYGQYRAKATNVPSRPAHPAFSRIPNGRLSDMPHSSAGLYRFVSADESGKLRPSMAASDPRHSMMRFSSDPDVPGEMDAATRKQMAGMASLVKSLAPDSPTFGGGSAPEKPTAHVEFAEDEVEESKIISVGSGDSSRSVVVNMSEEIDRLVSRIVTSKRYDKVAVEVAVGIGEDAVIRLIEHFPGPLLVDRHQLKDKLPHVGRHGHLLKALTKFGKTAVPHILHLLSSHESDVRFYATFLFSELKYPEALDTLTERVFDSDRHIRAIAVDVIRSFSAHPEYRWAVSKVISILESTETDLETKYLATNALGELGEPMAVETLVRLLSSADEKLTKMAHRALKKIALFDYGFSEKRWLDWYEAHRNTSRIEWAIQGLSNEEDDIRDLSYRALKIPIADLLEESPKPTNIHEYKELQARLKTWWQDEGKEIHHVVEGS